MRVAAHLKASLGANFAPFAGGEESAVVGVDGFAGGIDVQILAALEVGEPRETAELDPMVFDELEEVDLRGRARRWIRRARPLYKAKMLVTRQLHGGCKVLQ